METRADNARPRFFVQAVPNASKSEAEGRPMFDDREMVEIKIPGDRNFSWTGPVTEAMMINGRRVDSRARFSEQYAAFKRGEQRAISGTPLEHWPNPSMTASRVAELKAQDLLSVEELAALSDSLLGKLGMGARELREQARTYISQAKDGAETARLSAEVARLTAMVANLTGVAPAAQPTQDKAPEECTDAELRAYIKRETGQAVKGNPSRATLLARTSEIARKDVE